MFGWEFPPFSNGGLGTACYGLTKALVENGIEIIFVVPRGSTSEKSQHINLIVMNNLLMSKMKVSKIDSPLLPYMSEKGYKKNCDTLMCGSSYTDCSGIYGRDLYEEVGRYAQKAKNIAISENFDIIHCHDWMTFRAGMQAKEVSGKPLVVHVHATEFDRTAGHPSQHVYDMEKEGMLVADKIIAVSNFTKNKIIEHYGIYPDKVSIVHNGVDLSNHVPNGFSTKPFEKIVLFLGRITLQKGPDYFLHAAKKVLEHNPNVKFIVAGDGDMKSFMIEKAAELGIGDNVMFTGFLRGKDVDRAYQMADLYVMPSVSEPFGITPLEAVSNGTPVIISKQSGVSEVLTHCLKVDFWDINDIASKILAALSYKPLHKCLKENSFLEIRNINWINAASKCTDVYEEVLNTAPTISNT